MQNMEKIYRDLTGVNIREQEQIWDERGRGYYGEYLVMQKLYQQIPGTCKILMNLNLPVVHGKTTEVDLIMIHESGFYVFEIKHYKGTIYGKAHEEKWTQYFRTAPNHSFLNPVRQNEYHISALRQMFPGIPTYSMVVFTNDECQLHIDGTTPNTAICTLNSLTKKIQEIHYQKPNVYTAEQIDTVFNRLLAYAPEREISVAAEGEIRPFYEYIGNIVKRFKADGEKAKADAAKSADIAQDNANKAIDRANKSIKRTKRVCLALTLIFAIICAVVCGSIFSECSDKIAIIEKTSADAVAAAEKNASDRIAAAEKSVSDFVKKFEHVEELQVGDLVFSDELVSISNVVLANSKELENTVVFSCRLTCDSQNYKVLVGKDSMLNVILTDGSVKEYDLWNKKYPYYSDASLASNRIAPHDFSGVTLSDISYIKLTNLKIARLNTYPTEILAEGYEIELYDCTK